ncbi:MAG: M23 family metallopeptidase [Flavobacteriaceae bacterium]
MEEKQSLGKRIRKKLLSRYRLVIINETTFEEQLYFRISRLNVIIAASFVFAGILTLAFLLFSTTPLKEFIPGKASSELSKSALENRYKLDSITLLYQQQSYYLDRIQKVLVGDLDFEDLDSQDYDANTVQTVPQPVQTIATDSLLRQIVAQEDKYNPIESQTTRVGNLLFPPAKGTLSQGYAPEEKHYAVDIALAPNSPIKSIAEGTVIFSEWTAQTGYVIMIEHPYGLLSVYKHNASLMRTQGETVKAGEIIATAGNTGEFTTGWHLHFELWMDGYPMNPTQFIDFGNEPFQSPKQTNK